VNNIFHFPPSHQEPQSSEDLLAIKKQLQEARLELVAKDQAIARLTTDLNTLRARQTELLKENTQVHFESLLRDAAGPVAQLATQGYLLESAGKPVQARDILNIARRLVRALEKYGLLLEGAPGEETCFDPDRHTPLSTGQVLTAGQKVTVRIPGVVYNGKILARAGVESAGENQ
jgi:hypothetical protein